MSRTANDTIMSCPSEIHMEMRAVFSSNQTNPLSGVVDTYQHRICRYLNYLTGSRDETEDLSQELWLRVLRSGHTYKGDSSLETWLCVIGRNLVIDQKRRRRLLSFEELGGEQDGEGGCVSLRSREPTPFECFQRMELSSQIASLLLELDEKQSAVILLRFWADCDLSEISEITRTPLSTVKARLYRGLRLLQARVTKIPRYKALTP